MRVLLGLALVAGLVPCVAGAQGSGGDCQSFASEFLASSGVLAAYGVGLTPAQITAASGCYQASDGSWFLPADPNDPRLPAPILSAAEAAVTRPLRDALVGDVAALQAALSPYVSAVLASIYDPVAHPAYGHRRPDAPLDESVVRAYGDELVALVRQAGLAELGHYVVWWTDRRVSVEQAWLGMCLGTPTIAADCGIWAGQFQALDVLGQPVPPFPW